MIGNTTTFALKLAIKFQADPRPKAGSARNPIVVVNVVDKVNDNDYDNDKDYGEGALVCGHPCR